MKEDPRPRRVARAVLSAVLLLGIAACSLGSPNSTFQPRTEFGRDIDDLWDLLLLLGTIVFILVESMLIFTIVRFRYRAGRPEPKHVHGNTTLEVAWTLLPAVVLAFIAVPTIRTIFRTQAKPVPGALEVEVIGHQWWWEFRYPQYDIVTANELYIPVGRTVSFALKTADVLHSFWVPQLGGKRDLITNHTNYLWFTPETTYVWNGFCAEYCGISHANMKFRTFTVTPDEFDAWTAHQRTSAAGAAAVAAAGSAPLEVADIAGSGSQTPAGDAARPVVANAVFVPGLAAYPREKLPPHAVPSTPIPGGLSISTLDGDVSRGAQLFRTQACIACHVVRGVPGAVGIQGPSLTHVGSRTTIAAGLYPNDMRHLALWIKNSPAMKPGSLMPVFGRGVAPPRGQAPMGALDDQQIADIAAYLLSLK